MPLQWLRKPQSWSVPDGASLLIAAGPQTDWFVDPQRSATPKLNAPALLGGSSGDFLLSARVTVDFAGTYDAGVLVVYESDEVWAKLCFEYSPQREPMVVSVVTRGVSDDCNSFVVDGSSVWLRIGKIGSAYAFHASPTAATGASSGTLHSRAARRRSASPHKRRWETAVPSRSSRSPTRRRGSATCAAASRDQPLVCLTA